MKNPAQEFISGQMEHFFAEAKRLRDGTPLVEYKALIDMLALIQRQLGTIDHEGARARISAELKLAASEAVEFWRRTWREFWEQRRRTIEYERSVAAHNSAAKTGLSDLESSYAELRGDDDFRGKFRQGMRSILDDMHHEVNKDVEIGLSREIPWRMLQINMTIFNLYLRHFVASVSFFVLRHAFIFLWSILILGVAYGLATKALSDRVLGLFPQLWWIILPVVILPPLVKRYGFDPWVRKMQIRWELRRLRLLAFSLHVVRTFALGSRTHRRRAPMTQIPPGSGARSSARG